jgi:hypothetical protein
MKLPTLALLACAAFQAATLATAPPHGYVRASDDYPYAIEWTTTTATTSATDQQPPVLHFYVHRFQAIPDTIALPDNRTDEQNEEISRQVLASLDKQWFAMAFCDQKPSMKSVDMIFVYLNTALGECVIEDRWSTSSQDLPPKMDTLLPGGRDDLLNKTLKIEVCTGFLFFDCSLTVFTAIVVLLVIYICIMTLITYIYC